MDLPGHCSVPFSREGLVKGVALSALRPQVGLHRHGPLGFDRDPPHARRSRGEDPGAARAAGTAVGEDGAHSGRDPIRTLRAILAEKECALSPPPGRWAAQAPDTHHATLMYFVGLWALHGARAAGPNKKAVRSGEGGDRKRSSLLLAGCLSAAQVRRGQRRPGRRPTTQPCRLRRTRSSCTSAPQVHGPRLQAVRPRPRRRSRQQQHVNEGEEWCQ